MTNNPDTQTPTVWHRSIRPGMVIMVLDTPRTVVKCEEIKSKYGIQKVHVWFTDGLDIKIGHSVQLVGRVDLYRVTYTTPHGRRTETMTNAELIAKEQQGHNGIRVTSYRRIVSA